MSVAVPSRDCVTPFKRPHSTILDSSSSSSSSQTYSALGPLTLQASTSPACCPWPPDISTCIEEDELEMGSQPSTREWGLC